MRALALLLSMLLLCGALATPTFATERAGDRAFSTVEIFLDCGSTELAAYQLTLQASRPDTRLVGVEGGRGAAFGDAPHYDPRALRGGFIKLAALQLEGPLSRGRVHVATLHVEHLATSPPRLTASEITAVDLDGEPTPVEFSQEIGD